MSMFFIGDILIEIKSDSPHSFHCFDQFLTDRQGDAELSVYMRGCENIDEPVGTVLLNDGIKWVKIPEGGYDFCICLYTGGSRRLVATLEVDKDWKQAVIKYIKDVIWVEDVISGHLGDILFRNSMMLRGGLVLHASAIEWQGRGILFSAPSGTGKSTQAKLWEEHMGAVVINDDAPTIRLLDQQPYAYGTPWCGSSKKHSNRQVPLTAIVILEQSAENSICRFSTQQAVVALMPRCYLPYFDKKLMDLAIHALEQVISNTPVYLLKCRPDKEAVEMVHQCVK